MTGAWIFLSVTIALWLIGFGVALWMLRREQKRHSHQIDEWTDTHYRRRG